MFAVDWAVKKELRIYDMKRDKLKTITPTVPDFSKFLATIKKPTNPLFFEGGRC